MVVLFFLNIWCQSLTICNSGNKYMSEYLRDHCMDSWFPAKVQGITVRRIVFRVISRQTSPGTTLTNCQKQGDGPLLLSCITIIYVLSSILWRRLLASFSIIFKVSLLCSTGKCVTWSHAYILLWKLSLHYLHSKEIHLIICVLRTIYT